ncbi:tyrosine-type recombinase/integrase [Priestia megaterium]|uniref:Tyrosine-type recombinase/integrase n=1 Tax=Priestia megaterium TaxID=1404 RepID=A0A6H1PCK0_PRIMG|nr:tyrosine-type recombinase/integrase [Priestia megaterium]
MFGGFFIAKKTGIFDVSIKAEVLKPKTEITKGMDAEKALEMIHRQMQLNGYRERTLNDYILIFNHFLKSTNVKTLEEINVNTIYQWLDSMNVSASTKSTRLKCLKAVLSKCFNNGWLQSKFWLTVQIKLDKKVKPGAKQNDLNVLLSLLDTSTFIGLRDAIAILTLFKTGVRINTLGQIRVCHIDFTNGLLNLEGSIMKNHKNLKLPLDEQLIELYKVLIEQNLKIRTYYKQDNDFLFITRRGGKINSRSTNNAISKQLSKYAKEYNLPNINAHAIRRAYAKSLYDKGANIALISKALGHSNLAVTTQYLDLEVDEVAENLRDYL